jgi:hypothetical protein
MIDIVCFKWGPKFGPEYVNNFYNAVQRNTTVEHRFICYTDDPEGVDDRIETRPFLVDLPVWWYIIGIANPDHEHSEKVFYFDLDTVVTGNIDDILEMDQPFATISDFGWVKGLQTAFIMWDRETRNNVWDYFTTKYRPEDYANLDCDYTQWGGTNQFLEECMGVVRINKNPIAAIKNAPKVVRLQDEFPGACASYKAQKLAGLETLPEDISLVFFHGNPMPHQVNETWMSEHWA